MTASREEFFARWKDENDREALGALLLDEAKTIKRILAAKGGTPGDLSDIVQEAKLRFLRRDDANGLPDFQDVGALRGFLLKTAWNLCINRYRQLGRTPIHVGQSDTDSFRLDAATTGGIGRVERGDLHHALSLALNVLPEPDRQVLELYDLRSMNFATIARELGLPTADAARMRRKRALEHLSRVLAKWLDALN